MPDMKTLTEMLAERTDALNEWTRAELVNFIEERGLSTKPITSLTKAELVAIVAVHGSVFDIEPAVQAHREVLERRARVRPKYRSRWAVAK